MPKPVKREPTEPERVAVGVVLERLEEIFDFGPLGNFEGQPHIIKLGLWTQLLICCYDLCQYAFKIRQPINFAEDILPRSEARTIHDLLRKMRGGVCHTDGIDRLLDDISLTFTVIHGVGDAMRVKGVDFENPYPDDTALFIGVHRLLVRRHVGRVMEEARRIFHPPITPEALVREYMRGRSVPPRDNSFQRFTAPNR